MSDDKQIKNDQGVVQQQQEEPVESKSSSMSKSSSGEIEKTAEQIVAEQEALAASRYGGLTRKKSAAGQIMTKRTRKVFDSADWVIEQNGQKTKAQGAPLPPRVRPQ